MNKRNITQNTRENSLQIQKNNKRKAKKRKRRLFIIKSFIFLLLLTGIIVILTVAPLFNIKSVKVYGAEHLNSESIRATAGILPEVNGFKELGASMDGMSLDKLLLLRYQKQERMLLQTYPYIKNVKVVLKLPNIIEITLKERKPFVKAAYDDKYLVIDENGFILEQLQEAGSVSALELRGINLQGVVPGDFIGKEQQEKLDIVITLLDKLRQSDEKEGQDPKLAAILKFIDVTDIKGICMVIEPDLMVNLGKISDVDNRRLEVLRYLYRNNVKNGKGYLDFSSSPNPNYDPNGYGS